jgi:ribonuclease P protein component
VRRFGRSYADPLLVLVVKEEGNTNTKFAVTAGGSIGNAVKRNRTKRLIRAALQDFLPRIQPGVKGVIIARKPLANSSYGETRQALESLLDRAGIIDNNLNG